MGIYVVLYRNDEDEQSYIRFFNNYDDAKEFKEFKKQTFKYVKFSVCEIDRS